MPIYEYRCPDGHTFEVFQRMADPPSEVCEICGKRPVEKLLYPVAVHFKGSGFYSTDYGRGGRKREGKEGGSDSDGAGPSSGSDSSSGEKSTSGPESKPAPATD
jgi:putative FmdB family regulatory protein